MKKRMIKLAIGSFTLLCMSTSAEAGYTIEKKVGDTNTKLTLFGFAQVEAVGGKGMQIKNAKSTEEADTNVAFRAERIRLGWKYRAGAVRSKVFIDFNQKSQDPSATDRASVPNYIKDAFIVYKFHNAFIPKLGVMKMPNGMGFTMSGWNLDITERGFDKSLVLERSMGLMVSGRGIGFSGNKVDGLEVGHERPWKGFGYDIMVANQANRSKAVKSTAMGGNAYAVRAMFDYTEKLHTEISFAESENADGNVTATLKGVSEDYSNINVGIDSNLGKLSLKAEYTKTHNIIGIKDYDEDTFTATGAYFVMPNLELVAKHIQGSAQKGTNASTTHLGNTYIGFNLFLSQPHADFSRISKKGRNQQKVVVNYILATGSGATEGKDKWSGLGGYRANAFIAQYQIKF